MQIIGHRGAAGIAPENTIEGFLKAIAENVDWIELDVHLTKDGIPVVIHDETTKHIAKANIVIKESTYDEVVGLDTFSGNKIPPLQEVLSAIAGKCKVNIELKATGTPEKVVEIINILLQKGLSYEDFLISSFRADLLAEVYELDPKIRLALLHMFWPLRFLTLRTPLYGVGFSKSFVTRFIINMAKRRDLITYIYTVNETEEFDKFKSWGVDAICTDRPDKLKD